MKSAFFKLYIMIVYFLCYGKVSAQTPSVGATTVNVDVSPSGAATASIPIFCPPGTLGMQPQISINYNSNSGDGILGKNITLTGMSVISRTGNNYHLNGYQEGMQLDNTKDNFELDGNRLIWVGGAQPGLSGSIYRTEVDQFARITFGGNDFMVELKDGGRLFYGHAYSKLVPSGASWSTPTAYYLHRRYDIDGNYIEYVYDMPGGQIQLTEIKYTGFDCTLMGTRSCSAYAPSAPYNSINFTYKDAIASNKLWINNTSVVTGKILEKVEVYESTNKVRTYELSYTNNELHDYLIGIKEFNNSGESLPIVQLDWIDDNESKTVTRGFSMSNMNNDDYAQTYSGDFNGDGKSDLLAIEAPLIISSGLRLTSNTYYKIYTTTGSGSFSDAILNYGRLLTNNVNSSYTGDISNVLVGDVNQDGLDDIILQTIGYNWNSSSHMILNVQYHAMIATLDDRNRLQFRVQLDYFAPYYNIEYTRHDVYAKTGLRFTPYLGDFDGDGWIDLMEIAKNEYDEGKFKLHNLFITYGKNKTQKYHLSGLSGYYNAIINNEVLLDMNGNGKTDILLVFDDYSSEVELTGSNGDFSYLYYQQGFPQGGHKGIRTGDFNGDGKTDLMYYVDRWYIAYSTGNWWEEHDATTEWNIDNISYDHGRSLNYSGTILGEHFVSGVFFQIGDFNGDGKSDILERHYDPWGSTDNHFEDYKVIYYSKGFGFNRIHIGSNESVSNKVDYSYSLLADFDGDGKTDVFSREYATASLVRSFFKGSIEYFGAWNKRLQIIHSDASTQHQFVHKPIPQSSHYKKHNAVKIDQTVAMTPRLWITESYNFSVANTSVTKSFDYYYYQLLFHRHGRGMMGFVQTASVDKNADPNLTIAVVTENTQNPEFSYKLEPSLIQTFRNPVIIDRFVEFGDPIFKKEITNTSVPTIEEDKRIAYPALKGIHFPYVSKIVETDYVKQVQKFICFEYDKNGNMFLTRVAHKVVGNYAQCEHVDGTHNQFEQMGSWLPSMVKRTLNTKVRYDGSTSLPRYDNQVDITNTARNKVASMVKHGNNQELLLTEYTFYDQYGNVTINKVDYIANPTGSAITTQTNTYSSNGRFLATSKNILNQVSSYSFEPVYGNRISVTGANGLTSEYEYDNWGRLVKTTSADGAIENVARVWYTTPFASFVSNLTPAWYVYVSNSLGEKKWDYYDAAGRKIATKNTGFGSSFYYTNVLFDANNRISKESNVFSSGYDKIYTEITYDGYSRLLSKKYNNVVIARYTYDKTAVTEITKIGGNDVSKTTKTYATGHTAKVTDPGGEILYTLGSHNLPTQISTNGATTSLQYNDALQRTQLCDPNAGCVTTRYNALGQLVQQVDGKGNTYTMQYDVSGRLIKKTGGATEEYTYSFYDITGQGSLNKPKKEELKVGGVIKHSTTYLYGTLGELLDVEEDLPGNISASKHTYYTYDDKYRVDEVHYPNLQTKNVYDATNNHTAIKLIQKGGATANVILWTKTSELPNGTTTQFTYGNGFVNNWQHNANQILERIYSVNTQQSPLVKAIDNEYVFETESGNLKQRKDNLNIAFGLEKFFYDNADRLITIEQPLKGSMTTFPYMSNTPSYKYHIEYENNGNISGKYDAGEYEYDANKPHAVKKNEYREETLTPTITPYHHAEEQNITYTPFNKVLTINQANAQGVGKIVDVTFEYGLEQQRIKMEIKEDYSVTNSTLYIGSADMELLNSGMGTNEDQITYLYAEGKPFAMHRSSDNQIYYLHVDYQSSLMAISNEAGLVLERRSYDAWGRPRKAIDLEYNLPTPFGGSSSSFTMRGYTFHEHLEMVGLINMNGRVYDPILGRMLSPDNYVQASNSTQSYNRYSYCWNNPLKHTDPSGDFIFTAAALIAAPFTGGASLGFLPYAIGADIGMWQGGAMANGTANPMKWDYSSGKTWGYMAGGAVTGAAAAGVGAAIASSGVAGANTFAIIGASHINSVGSKLYAGGDADYTLSFGAASYNFDQNRWGFVGKEGNSGWDNFGYGLGTFANLSDGWAIGKGVYAKNANVGSKELQTNNDLLPHSGSSDIGVRNPDGMDISWGASGGKPFGQKGDPFHEFKTINKWSTSHIKVKNVLLDKYNSTVAKINASGNKNYNLLTRNCANQVSRAYLNAGVFNIPLVAPQLLELQMLARNYSYMSGISNSR